MKKIAFTAFLLLAFCVVAVAGEAGSGPSKIVTVTTYDLKPGKIPVFDGIAKQVRQVSTEANAGGHWLAASVVTGKANRTVIVRGYDSYASYEKTMNDFGKNLETAIMRNANFTSMQSESQQGGYTEMLALRKDLSYNLEKFDVPNATYWRVAVIKLQPGTVNEWVEMRKQYNEYLKTAQADRHFAVYEIVAGAGAGTFHIVSAIRSMADWDRDDPEEKKRMDAVFTPAVRQQLARVQRHTIAGSEVNVYRVRPAISHPEPQIVAANPTFWTVKEPEAVVATGKKKNGQTVVAKK